MVPLSKSGSKTRYGKEKQGLPCLSSFRFHATRRNVPANLTFPVTCASARCASENVLFSSVGSRMAFPRRCPITYIVRNRLCNIGSSSSRSHLSTFAGRLAENLVHQRCRCLALVHLSIRGSLGISRTSFSHQFLEPRLEPLLFFPIHSISRPRQAVFIREGSAILGAAHRYDQLATSRVLLSQLTSSLRLSHRRHRARSNFASRLCS